MRRIILMVFASVLVFSLGAAAQGLNLTLAPSTPAGAAPTPPPYGSSQEFPLRIDFSYQFTGFYRQDGLSFHNNGVNTDLTGYLGHDFALEGDVTAGFGWATYKPDVKLESSSIFYGGGVRIGPERTRFQPYIHVLLGGQYLRFSQVSPFLGSDNGFAYIAGAGADVRIGPRAFWTFGGDFLGTREFGSNQPNFNINTGIAFSF
ncbi:MAG: hypothetical protein WBF06_15945 [Candidatus Acidiferrales bacterium]